MAHDPALADRVRSALGARTAVREVAMFGGLSFMVNGAMVLNVGSVGDLLVRVDPGRADEYLGVEGASVAEMGAGRSMGRGWLAVDAHALATDEGLDFWVSAALDFNSTVVGDRRRGRTSRKRAIDDFGWSS